MSTKIMSNKTNNIKKRMALLFLCVLVTMSMSACGKSEAVKSAEEAIASIGTVTLDSLEAIENAEKLYGLLTDSEKEKVGNRLTLVEARESYDNLQGVKYGKAKLAYDKLTAIAEKCSIGMTGIHGAWYFGIYEADDYKESVRFSMLSSATAIPTSKLESAAEETGFSAYDLDEWMACLIVVKQVFESDGTISEIEAGLSEVGDILNELNDTYADSEYYPSLVEYYGKVNAYYEFFLNPESSFNELKGYIDSYERDIYVWKNQLAALLQ